MSEYSRIHQFKGTRLTMVIAISLILSLGLWSHFKFRGSVEVKVPAEIFYNVSDPLKYTAFGCLTNLNTEAKSVTLGVVCSRMDQDLLRHNDFALFLDLTSENQANLIPAFELKPGMARYIGPTSLKSKFEVVSVEPKRLKVVIDNIVDKSLPVLVELKGQPAEGYSISQTNISPSFVSVKGPEALLNAMNGVPTETISIEDLSQDLETYCSITLPDRMECRHHTARVKLNISHAPKIVTLEKVAIERFGMPQKDNEVVFEPATADIVLEVPTDELESFDPKTIRIFADVSSLAPDAYNLPIKVLPSKLGRVVKIVPETVHVTIRNAPTPPPRM